MSEEDESYCRQKARESDIDAYLAALFAPSAARNGLWALDAFAGEIARLPARTGEPVLGQIRLQWWREAIARLYEGKAESHPVLRALEPFIKSAHPPQSTFEQLIDARLGAMEDGQARSELAQFALLSLKQSALGGPNRLSQAVLEPAAQALGAAEQLRAPKAPDARQIAEQAQAAIARAARAFEAERTARGLVLLLPLASLRLTLRRLAKVDYARSARDADRPIYQKQWVMLRAALRGRL